MPTVEEAVKRLMWNYPVLFGQDQYSRWRVLNHLYFVLGNGYKWAGGEIHEVIESVPGLISKMAHKGGLDSWFLGIKLDKYFAQMGASERPPMRFYPISSGSLIATMPQDVTDDYLLWGKRLLDFAVASPAEWFVSFNSPKEQVLSMTIQFSKTFTDRWGDRLRMVASNEN